MTFWLLTIAVLALVLGLAWLGDRRRRGGAGSLDARTDPGRIRAQEAGGFNHHHGEHGGMNNF